MRAAIRVLLGVLVVVLGWLLAADLGLVPGKPAVDWLHAQFGPERPPPLPPTARYDGQPLEFSLSEPSAEFYGGEREPEPEDAPFVSQTESADLRYDPALAQAAREYATLYADTNAMLPGDALAFVLDGAGVVGWGVRQSVMVSNAPSRQNTERYLADLLDEGPARVGVGVAQSGGHQIIAVLSAGELVTLEPVPRSAQLDAPIPIRGRLPEGYLGAHVVAMRPDATILDVEVIGARREFAATLEPDEPGLWTVELLATGPLGPAPVTQMTIWVDEEAPETFSSNWPRSEARVHAIREAEARAARLVAADRERFGLPHFIRDPDLDAIARAHSEDMRDHDFVGHRSPRTGGPGDRLADGGFAVIGLAENVAFNRNLGDAQRGLMRSLGHRRNLLSTELTHVGLGAATDGESWYITQLFATPMPVLDDAEAAAEELLETLNDARTEPLAVSQLLNRAAENEAQSTRPTPRGALDRARSALQGKASAWVGKMASLEQFEPPAALLNEHFRVAGIAVHQAIEAAPPNIHVVVVLSQ